jgi:hypothetical protein
MATETPITSATESVPAIFMFSSPLVYFISYLRSHDSTRRGRRAPTTPPGGERIAPHASSVAPAPPAKLACLSRVRYRHVCPFRGVSYSYWPRSGGASFIAPAPSAAVQTRADERGGIYGRAGQRACGPSPRPQRARHPHRDRVGAPGGARRSPVLKKGPARGGASKFSLEWDTTQADVPQLYYRGLCGLVDGPRPVGTIAHRAPLLSSAPCVSLTPTAGSWRTSQNCPSCVGVASSRSRWTRQRVTLGRNSSRATLFARG